VNIAYPLLSALFDSTLQESSLYGYFRASDGLAFKGAGVFNIIAASLTPTRFTAPSVAGLQHTGYIQHLDSTRVGSQVSPLLFSIYNGITVAFAFTNALNTLDIDLNQDVDAGKLISSILGSLGGGIAAFASLMGILFSNCFHSFIHRMICILWTLDFVVNEC
jgi:hypothetical protein